MGTIKLFFQFSGILLPLYACLDIFQNNCLPSPFRELSFFLRLVLHLFASCSSYFNFWHFLMELVFGYILSFCSVSGTGFYFLLCRPLHFYPPLVLFVEIYFILLPFVLLFSHYSTICIFQFRFIFFIS